LLLVAAGCAGEGSGSGDGSGAGSELPDDALASVQAGVTTTGCGLAPPVSGTASITIDGTARSYVLAVPANYDRNQSYALVLAFHGAGSSGSQAQRYFGVQRASAGEAIVVYPDALPDANGTRAWGLTGAAATRDFGFVDALVNQLGSTMCVDSARIFAAGHSSGGYFSNALGCARGNTLRGIGVVAGGGPFVRCDGGQVAAWLEHSSDDPIVPVSAGQSSRDHWLAANHCTATTTAVGPSTCVRYDGCDTGEPVNWCAETSLGHNWPSYAGQAIWSFFSQLQ
jgi:poly(3-hydroxybutyrate) depolymerase